MSYPNSVNPIATILLSALSSQVEERSIVWLSQKREKIILSEKEMDFFIGFSQVSRYFKRNPLQLSEEEKAEIANINQGLELELWDQVQAARTYLLLQFPAKDATSWKSMLQKLFETGDMYELEALYAALPVMPFSKEMVGRAREGLRTNITSVFDAVALNNPYPSTYFDEDAWNQMVVKAIFMQRPLYKIQNSDQRANLALARIIIDFAHERWAAGRDVMPELWRFVGPFISEENIQDIRKVVEGGDELEQKAALLACNMSDYPEAKALLKEYPKIEEKIKSGFITWEAIGQEAFERN